MIRYTYDARGQMVAVYDDGTVVPVLGAEQAPGASPIGVSTPAPTPETDTSSTAGYARNSGYSRAAARDYSPRPPSLGSDFPPTPAYADGSQHPAQGGFPRTPGGPAAQQSADGSDGRGQQQVYVPNGGAAAGPFTTRAADPPRGAQTHGGSGGGSGGGGGGASSLYYAWRNKLEGKLMPGGSTYDSSSYDSGGYKEPKDPKMRGPYARGLDPDQALGLAYRPTAMIPRALPGISDASPFRETLANLPAYQLGILSNRGYKGTPAALANSIGRFYHGAGTTGDLPDFDTVFNNLAHPKQNGGIADLFNGVKAPKAMRKATGYDYEYGKEPLDAATAGSTFENLLGGALSLLPKETAAGYAAYASTLTDKAVLKNMKRPAGKGLNVAKYVSKRLFK